MQIKKDEVKNAILREAEKEFLVSGFEKASIRKIVKAAGTTIGNFYNYFENKEALFSEIVDEELENFKLFFENHEPVNSDYLIETTDTAVLRGILHELIEKVMPVFSNSLLILVECSKGTKYENIRTDIIAFLKTHFIEHVENSEVSKHKDDFAGVMAEQFLSGVLLIIRNYSDGKTRKELLTDYIFFTIFGMIGFTGQPK